MVAFAETSISRRKYILHYFGEEFDPATGKGGDMDDNMRFKRKSKQKKSLSYCFKPFRQRKKTLNSRKSSNPDGESNAIINSHNDQKLSFFGKGANKTSSYWMALLRQSHVGGFISKDIETYGVVKMIKRKNFITQPVSLWLPKTINTIRCQRQGGYKQ